MIDRNELRSMLASQLSEMYAAEVPQYEHLLKASARINNRSDPTHPDTQRLGTERHGAVRVASFEELTQLARLFAQYAMVAVGYYDLRSGPTPIPVVSTSFRPITSAELDASPFRMFCSTLVVDDDRFFSQDLQRQLHERQSSRQLFSNELIATLDAAEANGGVIDAQRFVDQTVDTFRLDRSPIERTWFEQLDAVSPVASDIAAAPNTHLNHLTPRVTDIELLHRTMESEGVEMIDRIQGPPAWNGPDLLLRQTSFRALDEVRTFVDDGGQTSEQTVRVRFGEVEQRGIAVTPKGRAKVDAAMASGREMPNEDERVKTIRAALDAQFAPSIEGLFAAGDIYVRHVLVDGEPIIEPITYEDFLPASAAGIFASNLSSTGVHVADSSLRLGDADRLRSAVGRLHDPYALYQSEQDASARYVQTASTAD